MTGLGLVAVLGLVSSAISSAESRPAYETRGLGKYGVAAQRLLIRAAEGHSFSQTQLARMYEEGKGISQNWTQAIKWYCEAAMQGDDAARARLRTLGVERDAACRRDAEAVHEESNGSNQLAHKDKSTGFRNQESDRRQITVNVIIHPATSRYSGFSDPRASQRLFRPRRLKPTRPRDASRARRPLYIAAPGSNNE